MSLPTPDSPDEPVPSKRRAPRISRLKKDNSELDLWDFDESAKPDTPAQPEATPAPDSPRLPKGKSKAPKEVERAPRPLPPSQLDDSTIIRQSAQISRRANASDPLRKSKPADDIGELDDSDSNWSDPDLRVQEATAPIARSVVEAEPEPDIAVETAPTPEAPANEEPAGAIDEFTPSNEIPIDTRPIRERLGLSKIEKIGLGVLAAALTATAIFFLTSTLGRVPTISDRSERPSYPVKGSHVRINDANSYWREPVRTGPGAETVRRGTLLIPVVTLELEGGPCAIRAFFRDDKGEFVGDGVTRAASSGKIEIAATAGLDDLGAHAAYRTGETKPWKIEIFEAPGVDSPRQEFKKLLNLTISTDRR
ncbi:MAG: hypothetical protein CFE26_19675 [Verrucomicrobiales bacterium VVV1]|nr:MAG: hypothetical protein CFE26_19675 [Verrucomicrobiales bacterium VVV1]